MYDIIIIGAGPAGLTAAIYAMRAAKKTLVLEAMSYGGQIINARNIENYPGEAHTNGFELATKMYEQAKDLGCEIKLEKVIQIEDKDDYKEIKTTKKTYQTKTVIIATGTTNCKLNLPNEEELVGKGISYCATCDGNFYKNKDVAVIGGGKVAIEDALYLSDIVNKVYLIHSSEKLRIDQVVTEKIHNKKNIEIIDNSKITKLLANNYLTAIEIITNDTTKEIPISGLFIAIDRIPENNNFKNLIKLDEKGYIIANENCHTNIPGIYVAGDIRTKSLRQLVTATADGGVAASEAIKYIESL